VNFIKAYGEYGIRPPDLTILEVVPWYCTASKTLQLVPAGKEVPNKSKSF
jgi:hypothetical protein